MIITKGIPGGGGGGGMELIEEVVLASAVASVTFNSIPQTYRSLLLAVQVRGDVATTANFGLTRFNNDLGSNYAMVMFRGQGNNAHTVQWYSSIDKVLFPTYPGSTGRANMVGRGDMIIYGYADSNWEKTVFARTERYADLVFSSDFRIEIATGLWKSTAPITRIDIATPSNNFVINSRFALYGIL